VSYLGAAGGAWAAGALVAGGAARVAAVWTRQRAGLQAAAPPQTVAPVADPSAAVHLARQRFVTRQATGDVLQVTRDVAALLRAEEKRRRFKITGRKKERKVTATKKKGVEQLRGTLPRAFPCTISE